jgi:iron complex outermembrane receptor protein
MVRKFAYPSVALLAAVFPGAAFAQTPGQTAPATPTQTITPAASQAAPAAEESEEDIARVIVTARRREEAVRDVPSTITAISVEQLEAKSPIEGVGDLLQTVPGTRFNGVQAENLAEVSIRGSGTQRATSADSGVGLFVNGAYVGSSTLGGRNFKRIDYFDLARIETLEGPQGALYGRNSEFGTVNIVLARPQFDDTGRLSATYTDDLGQLRLEGVTNNQLSDTIAVRFGAQVTGQGGGIFYNPNQDKYYDHTDGYIVRGQMRYRDGPWDVNFLVDAQDMNLPTFVSQWVVPAGRVAALPQGYFGPDRNIPSDVKNSLHQEVLRAMLIADYDVGWATLTSTSMYSHSISKQSFAANIDLATEASFQAQGWIGLYPLGGTSTNARDVTLYQDIHLAGDALDGDLEWLAGIEFLKQSDNSLRDTMTSPCALTATSSICGGTPAAPVCYRLIPTAAACPTVFPLAFGSRRLVPSDYQSGAAYGLVTYDFGALELTGELRYSTDEKSATQSDFRLYTTTPIGTPSNFTFDEASTSYAATAAYHFNEANLVYFRTGTGYRAGGVNTGNIIAAAPNPLRPSYGNEETTAYEVGLKSSITRNIFLRLSAYTSETQDAIALVNDGCTVANACGVAASNFNINGGVARVNGIEAALDSVFSIGTGRLAIGLNAANQDASYVEVAPVAGAPILDSPVAQTPDWTFSANVNYRQPLGDDLAGFFNVAYNAQRGGGQDTVTATAPFIPLEDIDNVDMRLGFDFQHLQFTLFIKNVTDQVIPVLKLQQGDIPLANRYSRPRTFGVSVGYRW